MKQTVSIPQCIPENENTLYSLGWTLFSGYSGVWSVAALQSSLYLNFYCFELLS